MADISTINVGGIDYSTKDATARSNASTALTQLAYQETGNTASQAYSVIGTPINWKGTLYYTKTAVAKGATWAVGTNLTAATNLGKLTSNIKTYVNSSGKLVFRDLTGADTVLPFSGTPTIGRFFFVDVLTNTATVDNNSIYLMFIYNGGGTQSTLTINSGGTILQTMPCDNYTNAWVAWIIKTTSTTLNFTASIQGYRFFWKLT